MKLSDIIDLPCANWNSNNEQFDLEKLKCEEYEKSLPKRFKLRAVDMSICEKEYKSNWDALLMMSMFQGLVVVFMFVTQLLAVDYTNSHKSYLLTNFVSLYWVCVASMAIATVSTALVNLERFRNCILTAMAFQYSALFIWSCFLWLGMNIVLFSDKKELSTDDRLVVIFSFVLNFATAPAAYYNGRMLWWVGGFKARNKIREFNIRHGKIIFEMDDADEEPPRPKTPDDNHSKYDLI